MGFRKASTMLYTSGESIKHIRTTIVPGSKKSSTGTSRQNSGSPTPTRKISPLKKSEVATKVFRGIAL